MRLISSNWLGNPRGIAISLVLAFVAGIMVGNVDRALLNLRLWSLELAMWKRDRVGPSEIFYSVDAEQILAWMRKTGQKEDAARLLLRLSENPDILTREWAMALLILDLDEAAAVALPKLLQEYRDPNSTPEQRLSAKCHLAIMRDKFAHRFPKEIADFHVVGTEQNLPGWGKMADGVEDVEDVPSVRKGSE